ncbi:hypothetical protein L5515_008312 [Caenorhabditis briggsae]|uniref:G-protein coupled receptors family 1 profile domain-containing protein n=1 Tax=Caenorhabditis briggsae TaxID=6238 RepID=A0AAE9F5U0_CAEBR|nr:hypothetical protein L5515_008312 [Caenorhabditis briggsae]
MAIDLLLAVVMPIRHKLWQRGPYLLILCTPPILFSSFAIFIEQLYINHENLLMCTVSLAAPRNVRFWGTIITFSTVLLAVALIIVTAVKVHINEQAASSPFIRHSFIHTPTSNILPKLFCNCFEITEICQSIYGATIIYSLCEKKEQYSEDSAKFEQLLKT